MTRRQTPSIPKLNHAIDRFNQGCAFLQKALGAWQEGDLLLYEASLRKAATEAIGALEWFLKIYLCSVRRDKITTEDGPKLKQPDFNDLMSLMRKYADPPLGSGLIGQLYEYREIFRNASEHDAAVPPSQELCDAIQVIRQVILTYLPVDSSRLMTPARLPGESGKDIMLKKMYVPVLVDEVARIIRERTEAFEHLAVWREDGNQAGCFSGDDGLVPRDTPRPWVDLNLRRDARRRLARWRWEPGLIFGNMTAEYAWQLSLTLTLEGEQEFSGPCANVAAILLFSSTLTETLVVLEVESSPREFYQGKAISPVLAMESRKLAEEFWQRLRMALAAVGDLPAEPAPGDRETTPFRVRVPSRQTDLTRWQAVWKLARPGIESGRPINALYDELKRVYNNRKLFERVKLDTFYDIVQAGQAGLLDH